MTTERTPRQRQFIEAAAQLFSERGYHAVSINEISAAIGLSGPAIYRHYTSKEALLVAVLDDAITYHLDGVRQIVASHSDPAEALDAIVAHHVSFVIDQTGNIVTWRTEFHSLPEADRHRLRYLQRLYIEEWVRTVKKLSPQLDDGHVRAICHAAIGLIQSYAEFHRPLSTGKMRLLLHSMALKTLAFGHEVAVDNNGNGAAVASRTGRRLRT